MGIRECISLLLSTTLVSSTQAFAQPAMRPAFGTRSRLTRLYFESEESSEPENALVHQVQQNFLGIDEDYVTFPCPDYTAPDVVEMCMNGMQNNDAPYNNAGLEICYNFSNDMLQASHGRSLDAYTRMACNPILPCLGDSVGWTVVNVGPINPGTKVRGAMQTVLVDVCPEKGKGRTFLWTLQQERRPPRQGCWLVHQCIATDQAYLLTM